VAKATNKVEFEQGAISIDATIIAEGLVSTPRLCNRSCAKAR